MNLLCQQPSAQLIVTKLNACANSVYQALLRFSRAPGTRLARTKFKINDSEEDQPHRIKGTEL